MKDFSELIKRRRSMRKFTDEKLTQDEVVTLLKAGLMAPSSKGSHCWQFIVIEEKETLERLSHCKATGSTFLKEAALAIAVVADPLESDVWIEDAAVAATLIHLQAEDLGLGSCWIQIRERFATDGTPSGEIVHEALNLPLQLQPVAIIAIGHKGMERRPFNEDNLLWEKVHLNQYGGQE